MAALDGALAVAAGCGGRDPMCALLFFLHVPAVGTLPTSGQFFIIIFCNVRVFIVLPQKRKN